MKLQLPSWLTTALGALAGVLAILNQTTLHAGSSWSGYITVALVFLAGLGISPLVGEKFQSAVHLSPKVGIVISSALAALAVALGTLNVSAGVKGIIQGVIVFAAALGFAPAVTYALGRRVGRFGGKYRKYKGGRLPPFWPPALKEFTAYATKLVQPPVTFTARVLGALPIDGNDKYGDCTIAGIAHLIQIWNWLFGRSLPVPGEAEIDSTYFRLTGGGDTGLVEANVLKTFKTVGLFGQKIKLYAPIKVTNRTAIKQAIAFYGGVYLGILCPESAQRAFQRQLETGKLVPWKYEGESTEDGHCIVGIGFNEKGVECATWGGVVLVEWSFFDHYLEEAWAVLSQALVEKGEDTLGLDVQLLEADIASA